MMTRITYPFDEAQRSHKRRTLTYAVVIGSLILLLFVLAVSIFRSLTAKPESSAISPIPEPARAAVLGEEDITAIQKALVDSVAALDDRITSLEDGLISSTGSLYLSAPYSAPFTGQNLIRNSSFESAEGGKPRQWTYMYDSTTGNTFQSKEGIRSGAYGLKFVGGRSTGNGLDLGLSQPETETVPGRTYTLSFYLKHTNIKGEAYIRLGFWDRYNNRFGPMKVIPITGTKDWTRVSTTVTTSGLITDHANWYPMIEVRRLKDGEAVYLDDVQLEEGSVLTLYNSAVAAGISNSFTSGFGDGSILATPNGQFYPALHGIGTLGTPSNRWNALYLSKATINENGDLSLDGTLAVGHDLAVSGRSTFDGEVTLYGETTVKNDLSVEGTTTLKGDVTIGDSSTDTITVKGTPTFMNLSSFAGGITVGENGEFSIGPTGNITKIRSVSYSFPTTQGAANDVLINDGAGNLSWGSLGAATVDPDSLDFSHFKDAMAVDAATSINLFSGSAQTLRFFNSNTASDLFFLDGATGRVGVGTQTPNAKLDVSGNIFPTTTLTHDVGSATYEWNNLYLGGTLDLGTNTVTDGTFTGNWGFSGGNLSNIGTISSGAITSTGTSLFANLSTSGTLTVADGTASSPALTFTNDTNTGVYRLDEDKIGLITGGSPTQGIIVDGSGNVGMGTTTPGYKLDIAGSLNFTGTLNAGGSSGTLGQLLVSQGISTPVWQDIDAAIGDSAFLQGGNTFGEAGVIGTDDNYALYFVTNGTEQMAITNTGNVGIGTTDPAATLEVAGNIVGSTISDGTVTITNGNITGAGTVTATSFSGSGSSLTDLNASNLASGTVPDARISGIYTSAVTLSNALNSFTGSGAGLTSLNADNLASGTVPSGRLSGSYTIDVAGNATTATTLQTARTIAIGTGATGTATSFDGSGNITIPITAINADYITSGTIGSARVSGAYSGITGVGILDAGSITSGFGDINIGSSIFTGNGSGLTALNASNLSTGTVPSGRLSGTYTIDIAGNASTATSLQTARTLWGQSFDGTGNVSGSLTSVGDITGSGAITLSAGGTNQNIRLTPSGTGYTLLDGNVGVGTTSPNYLLDVNGTARIASTLTMGGNIILNGRYLSGDGGNEGVYVDSSGNVAIGQSSASYTLDVLSTIRAKTSLNAGDSDVLQGNVNIFGPSAGTIGGELHIHTAADYDSTINRYTMTTFQDDLWLGRFIGTYYGDIVISDTGNVGIGNTTPVSKLDVAGTAWLRGTGTSGLFVNSSGNVGVGTTAPGAKLEIAGSSGVAQYLTRSSADASSGSISFRKDRSAIVQSGDELGWIDFLGYDGSAYRRAATILSQVDGTPGASDMPGRLTFWTTPDGSATAQERLRITNDGNVGIGTTTPVSMLEVEQNMGADITATATTYLTIGKIRDYVGSGDLTGDAVQLDFQNGDRDGNDSIRARIKASFEGTGTVNTRGTSLSFWTKPSETAISQAMTIMSSGNVGIGTTAPGYKLQVGMAGDGTEARANAWNTLSDQNLKENISVLGSPLDVIEKLQGVKFNWKATGEESMGFIAQDLEKVLPQVVSTGADGYKSVNYPIMNALLVEGMKELNKKVDANIRIDEFGNTVQTTLPAPSEASFGALALENDITPLKDRVTALEEKLGTAQTEQEEQIASVSASLAALKDDVEILKGAQFTASVSAFLEGNNLPVTDDQTTLPNLVVTGHTNVYDLAVTGRMTAGLLAIDGLSCIDDENCAASISTFSGPLKIQDLASGAVEIMAGKVVIDTNGDMKIEGTLTVGEVKADTVTTKNLELGNDVVFTSGDTAPTGTCQTGAVYVWNDKAADEARMYICTKKAWEEVESQ